jgi:Arc/MetJ family transcription regulator
MRVEYSVKLEIEIDEDLWVKARRLSGIRSKAALIEACFKALIERESARRLAARGGTEPRLVGVSRRRLRADPSAGQ